MSTYPTWISHYANEHFDRAQALAQTLTDEDRAAARPAPACGYSPERFTEAARIVDAANLDSMAAREGARRHGA